MRSREPDRRSRAQVRERRTSVSGARVRRAALLSPEFQFIRRPGYSEDRGPVRFYGLRVHLEY
jgi:hypothetical protein